MIIQKLLVQLNNSSPIYRLKMRQSDSGRIAVIEVITGDGLPFDLTGTTIEFRAKKPDGKEIVRTEGVSHEENVVAVELTQNTLAVAGIVDCEIIIANPDGELVGTAVWQLDVWEAVIPESDLVSQDDYQSIIAAVAVATGARDEAQQYAADASTSEAGATAAADRAEGYTNNPPYPGDSGNWMIWNGTEYVDSGKSWEAAGGYMQHSIYDPVGGSRQVAFDDDISAVSNVVDDINHRGINVLTKQYTLDGLLGNAVDNPLFVSTSGNDETGDGTLANPYKTVQAALDTVPKNIAGQTVYIGVLPASNHAGFTIQNFYGSGELAVLAYNSDGTRVTSTDPETYLSHRIAGQVLASKNAIGRIHLYQFGFQGSSDVSNGHAVYLSYNSCDIGLQGLWNANTTGFANNVGGIQVTRSAGMVYVYNSTFRNQIRAVVASHTMGVNMYTGNAFQSSNTYDVVCQGSHVRLNLTPNTYTKAFGGIITNGSGNFL